MWLLSAKVWFKKERKRERTSYGSTPTWEHGKIIWRQRWYCVSNYVRRQWDCFDTTAVRRPSRSVGMYWGLLFYFSKTKGNRIINRPLQNWSIFRKSRLLFVICIASFAGNVAALAGQEAYPLQSKVYNVTVIQSSYSVYLTICHIMKVNKKNNWLFQGFGRHVWPRHGRILLRTTWSYRWTLVYYFLVASCLSCVCGMVCLHDARKWL